MNNREIKVDILMATYNGEKYIKQQLDSILNQTYANFNIIIADDKSTDSTLDILLDYQKMDPRISMVQNEQNLGVIKNFEKLINISTAQYFMLCDQDDVWLETKIEKSLNAIVETKAMIAFSDLQLVDQNLKLIHKSFLEYQGIKGINNINWKTLLVQNVVTGCTVIADKNIKRHLPFPNNIPMHDSWLALIASIHGEIHFINEALILYRQHESNTIGGENSDDRLWRIDEGYSRFLQERRDKLGDYIQILSEYRTFGFDNEIVNNDLEYLINSYRIFAEINRLSFGLESIKLKIKYPSIGVTRNVWWALYLQYPVISYIILNLKKKMYRNRNIHK